MEKSLRGKKHICSNCNTKFFDFNKEKIICPNCKTEVVIKKKASVSSDKFKIKEEIKTENDDVELSEEVEFNDDNDLNEILLDDNNLDK